MLTVFRWPASAQRAQRLEADNAHLTTLTQHLALYHSEYSPDDPHEDWYCQYCHATRPILFGPGGVDHADTCPVVQARLFLASRGVRYQPRGQALAEYALVLALGVLLILAVLVALGPELRVVFDRIQDILNSIH